MNVFKRRESKVRSYCRVFDKVFTRADGHLLFDENGQSYIDFLAGAGSMNYGHNHPLLQQPLIEYLKEGGLVHGLDLFTAAKRTFLERFENIILHPRALNYKVMFPGPTGTNAVEAALKLARKVTGRTSVISFTNGYHGMTLGSLALTGNTTKREGAGVPLQNGVHMPFDGYLGDGVDTVEVIRRYLEDGSSGVEIPAAFILETIQGEGGVNIASDSWLEALALLAKQHDILMIVDDIQVGCGRTGSFFSFEGMDFEPDMVTLSKSLSGYGLPLAVTLFNPELDQWSPGEHNGTFRGNNPAFVTAAAALEFWRDNTLACDVVEKGEMVRNHLQQIAANHPDLNLKVRGKGLIWGLDFGTSEVAEKVSRRAFENGVIVETAGARDQVLKLLPPLNIDRDALETGLEIIAATLIDQTASSREEESALASA